MKTIIFLVFFLMVACNEPKGGPRPCVENFDAGIDASVMERLAKGWKACYLER